MRARKKLIVVVAFMGTAFGLTFFDPSPQSTLNTASSLQPRPTSGVYLPGAMDPKAANDSWKSWPPLTDF